MEGARRAYDVLRGYVNREWDRLQGDHERDALTELDAPLTFRESAPELPPIIDLPQARNILGVSADASFHEIRDAFRRIDERSDPAKFPTGSPEAAKAADIRRRVRDAFALLSEHSDPTERRFGTLEID
jgi:hypothetical protein